MFRIPFKLGTQKRRITSRLFSMKSTVEYIKSNKKVVFIAAISLISLATYYASLKEKCKDTGLGVAISALLPSKIKGSEVSTIKNKVLLIIFLSIRDTDNLLQQ